MERQPKTGEALREHFQNPPGVGLAFESHHGIVGETYEKAPAF